MAEAQNPMAAPLMDSEGFFVAPNAQYSTSLKYKIGQLKVQSTYKLAGTKAISLGFVDKSYFDGMSRHFEFSLNVSFFLFFYSVALCILLSI